MDTMPDADRRAADRVAEQVDAWIAAGIISPEQGAGIRAFETAGSETRGSDAHGSDIPGSRHHSVLREVLGYVGAALVAVAVLVLVSDVWNELGRAWQIIVCAAAAAGLTAAAILIERRGGDRATRRLAQSILLLGTVPTGLAVGLTADLVVSEDMAVVIGFLGAAGYGGFWYARDRAGAQHVALFGAAIGTALTVGSVMAQDEALWVTAPLVMVLGASWTTASTIGVLPPRIIGQVLGCGALGLGSVLLVAAADPASTLGAVMLALMVLVSVVCLGIGAKVDAVVLIATGVIGLLGYVPWLVTEVFGNSLGVPIGLAIAGAALLTAMARIRR
jgi:hypothetical protein